jgi:hypothetical protein
LLAIRLAAAKGESAFAPPSALGGLLGPQVLTRHTFGVMSRRSVRGIISLHHDRRKNGKIPIRRKEGPMADFSELVRFRLGYAVDPAITQFLAKEDLIRIRVREIDSVIHDYQSAIENLQFTKAALEKTIAAKK